MRAFQGIRTFATKVEHFPGISKIKYDPKSKVRCARFRVPTPTPLFHTPSSRFHTPSQDVLAFKHYNAKEVVLGRVRVPALRAAAWRRCPRI